MLTSLIIYQLLGMRYSDWTIVAAFGDNLADVANELCEKSGDGEE